MESTTDERDPIERLAEEFMERRRGGEKPTVQEYASRYPELAAQIRALFPAVLMMEDLRPASASGDFTLGDEAPAPLPEKLGDYRLLREIGRGGMGVVYEAEQASLGRHVAVKVLRTGPMLSPKYRQRFEREARSAGRLHHTNIVPVFGVGHQEDQCYYVMQYIHGQGLDAVIEGLKKLEHFRSSGNQPNQGATPRSSHSAGSEVTLISTTHRGVDLQNAAASSSLATSDVAQVQSSVSSSSSFLADRKIVYPVSIARIGEQAAEALDYAHSQGIVHRDIKPSNLILDMKGDVWITDFGLAKATDSDDLTCTGDFVGTLRYMAPERFRGDSDGRSDVYGLGLTLYELLVGRPAYDETDRNALIHEVTQREPPDVASLDPGLPRDLCTIVRKSIARDPNDRYQTAGAMAEDLRRFLEDRPILARPASWLERSRRWCQRNRAVATLAASLIFVLFSGLAVVFCLWWIADTLRGQEADQRRQAVEDRASAEAAREAALAAQLDREKEADRANDLAKANHRQLVQMSVSNGARSWHAGDHWTGLLWFAEALRLDQGDLQHERTHRARLKNFSEQSPHLKRVWHVPGGVGAAEFSPDGRLVVAAGHLRWGPASEKTDAAHLWDAVTGQRICPPIRHEGLVRHAGFSRDGSQFVTACDDGAARIWDSRTGALAAGPFRHEGKRVMHAGFSPDGRRIATASEDGVAQIWDIKQGSRLFGPLSNPDRVVHVEFSPDGELLASATFLSQVSVWNANSGERKYPAFRGGVRAWFSPDSKHLLTGFNAPSAVLWDVAQADKVTRLLQFSANSGCRHAAFSPDGQRAVVCYDGQGAQIWDLKAGRPLTPILSIGTWVWHATFSPDGRTLATVGDDRVVRFWDGFTGRTVFSTLPHASMVLSISFHPNGQEVLTSTDNGIVSIWELRADPKPERRFAQNGSGNALAFSEQGTLATAVGRTVRVWNSDSGEALAASLEHPSDVLALIFDATGEKLFTGDQAGNVRIWDTKKGKLLAAPLEQTAGAMRFERSEDSRTLLVVTSKDNDSANDASVWDIESRRKLWTMPRKTGTFKASLSSDGRKVAVGSEFEAQVWDVQSGRALTPVMKHRGEIWRISFSPDARRVVTACSDSSLNGMYAQVWDAATGEPAGPNLMHSDGVLVAAYSKDGKRIVSGGDDKLARVWDAETGKPVTPALRHTGVVIDTSFSSDGRFILCRTGASAHVWEADTGHPVAYISPSASGGRVVQAQFRPDAHAFVTLGDDGIARLWPLRSDKRSVEEWVGFTQLNAGHRIDAAGGFAPLSGTELEERWNALKP